ncbi:MAG: hypothetical protein V1911_00075 [Candidatus Micrarchaeota archaeon]
MTLNKRFISTADKSKGQAFDTFKLMIAAVVAVAILTILLNIIYSIQPNVGQKPVEVASTKIKDALQYKCAPQPSSKITFTTVEGWTQGTFDAATGQSLDSLTNICCFDAETSSAGVITCKDSTSLGICNADSFSAKTGFDGRLTAVCNQANQCNLYIYTEGDSPKIVCPAVA